MPKATQIPQCMCQESIHGQNPTASYRLAPLYTLPYGGATLYFSRNSPPRTLLFRTRRGCTGPSVPNQKQAHILAARTIGWATPPIGLLDSPLMLRETISIHNQVLTSMGSRAGEEPRLHSHSHSHNGSLSSSMIYTSALSTLGYILTSWGCPTMSPGAGATNGASGCPRHGGHFLWAVEPPQLDRSCRGAFRHR